MRSQGSLLTSLELSSPWSIDFEQAPRGAPTHYIAEGAPVWFEMDGYPPLELRPGDLVMLPQWGKHALKSSKGLPILQTIRELVSENEGPVWQPGFHLETPFKLVGDGDGEQTTILSFVFELGDQRQHPILSALPPLIYRTRAENELVPLMQFVGDYLKAELENARIGFASTSSRLAELLFIQILRQEIIERPNNLKGWLRGLVDPKLGRLLAEMHSNPLKEWSAEEMALSAGLSRTLFFEYFKKMVGVSPAKYLRDLRMDAAAERLTNGETVKAVARRIGYATPFAFSEAFKKKFGCSPGMYRRGSGLPNLTGPTYLGEPAVG